MPERPNEQPPREDAEHDRRQSVQHVRQKADDVRESCSRAARRDTGPAPIPIGNPITDAMSTMIPVPTIAFAMPPSGSPVGAGICVKKFQIDRRRALLQQMRRDENQAADVATIAATYVSPIMM